MSRYQRWRPKISAITLLKHLKDVSLIKVPVETSLQRAKLVSLT